MSACLAIQILIPPNVLRMVILKEEGCWGTMEIGLCCQLYGIAEEWEVEVGIEIDGQCPGVHSRYAQFCFQIEMECLSLTTRQLSANIQTVSSPLVESPVRSGISNLRYSYDTNAFNPAFIYLLKPSSKARAAVFLMDRYLTLSKMESPR